MKNVLIKALKGASVNGSVLALRSLFVLLLLGVFSVAAFASGGENIKLEFQQSDQIYLIASLGFGLLAIGFAVWLSSSVLASSPGSEKMQEIGKAIKDGALAYLSQQIRTMSIFVFVLAIGLFALYYQRSGLNGGLGVALCFVLGVSASYLAGYAGMIMAVNANMRTAHAALTSYQKALHIAFRSGGVAGMYTVGLGLLGATLILWIGGAQAMTYLVGFGFGGSLAALFMRVGGGIFTKAADVGADLVGKVEAGIPEDDPRNPAVIADNVGDNVGDCAGMAADIFESYEVTLVAAIVLGAATAAIFDTETWMRLVLFALMARGVGVIASIVGILMVKGSDDVNSDPLIPIARGFRFSGILAGLLTFVLAYFMMGGTGKTIDSHQLTPIAQFQPDDAKSLQRIQRKLASAQEVTTPPAEKAKEAEAPAAPEITAKQVLETPEAKALGYVADDEGAVEGLLRLKSEEQLPIAKLDGFQRISNFSDKKIPALEYAMQTPQYLSKDVTNPPQYSTVATIFGSEKKELQLIVGKIRVIADIPAAPATPNSPAREARKVDQVTFVGPIARKELDGFLKEQIKYLNDNKIKNDIKLESEINVGLYVNKAGDLAMAAEGKVFKAYSLRSAIGSSYFKADIPTVQAAMNQAPEGGVMPKMPEQKTFAVAVAKTTVVPWWAFAVAIFFGIIMAFAIELLTDYYVSTHKKPTQEVAAVATAGPAPMIIQGFAYAAESSVFMVFAIVAALLFPLFLFSPADFGGSYILSFYGIALVGLGLLTTTGYVLAMDTFGPISDNAQGIYEMSGEGRDNEYGTKAVQRLDAAGNTTKALTKGFAIATAVVAAVALFHSYLEEAKLGQIGLRLDVPEIFLGLMIGGAAPYLFSASTINAVGRAAFDLINEVRRQFREDPGIMLGTSKPDYARCVALVTAAAQRELLGPGILAIALPAAVAFGFSIGKPPTEINGQMYNLVGAQALGGFLAGTIVSGQLMAVLLANSGGMWDNAKKIIEDGLHGGKGTEAHRAAVVCDTVGDPFKDTAGPALNPLIKVMNLVALLLAGVIIMPLDNLTLVIITSICVGLLVISIYVSKKGSMSTAMQASKDSVGTDGAAVMAMPDAPASGKRRITVEDEE